jgi:uncharacterized protein (TIGR03437 family)
VVELLDQFHNPQPRVNINFTASNAILSAAAAVTDEQGRASVQVRLGNRPTATITAQFGNLPSVTFNIQVRRTGPPLPQISAADGVIGAGRSSPPVRQVSVAAIVSIFGGNFAPAGTGLTVGEGDLVDGKLPTSFGGVCVTFNGVAGRLFYVSDTQVNVQVPELPSLGQARVVVIANCGQPGELRSDEQTVEVQATSPEFFYFTTNPDGRNPIAAVNAITGALVGPPGAVPGATLVPAGPNDIVTLFATGFGATRPSVGTGERPSGPASCATTPIVMLDGDELPAESVLYCGVTPGAAGLYQLNLQLPANLRNGNLALAVRFGLLASPTRGFLHAAGGSVRNTSI